MIPTHHEQEQVTDLAEDFGPELEPGFRGCEHGSSLWASNQGIEGPG